MSPTTKGHMSEMTVPFKTCYDGYSNADDKILGQAPGAWTRV